MVTQTRSRSDLAFTGRWARERRA